MAQSAKPTDPYLTEKQDGPSPYAAKTTKASAKKKRPVLSRHLLGDGLAGQAVDSLRRAQQKLEKSTR